MTPYDAENFRKEIVDTINNTQYKVTIPTAFYILKDILRDFEESYNNLSKQEPQTETKTLDDVAHDVKNVELKEEILQD